MFDEQTKADFGSHSNNIWVHPAAQQKKDSSAHLAKNVPLYRVYDEIEKIQVAVNLIEQHLEKYNQAIVVMPSEMVGKFVDYLSNHNLTILDALLENSIKLMALQPLPDHRFYFVNDYELLLKQISQEIIAQTKAFIFLGVSQITGNEIEQAEARQLRDFALACSRTDMLIDVVHLSKIMSQSIEESGVATPQILNNQSVAPSKLA